MTMLTLSSLGALHLMQGISFVTGILTHDKKIRTEIEAICTLCKTHSDVRLLPRVLHSHYKVAG